jgi:cell division cycle protein 37
LKEVIAKMPEEDAKYHIKRCVDSGLWVPDASQLPQQKKDEEEEEIYEEVKEEAPKTDDLDLD